MVESLFKMCRALSSIPSTPHSPKKGGRIQLEEEAVTDITPCFSQLMLFGGPSQDWTQLSPAWLKQAT
jgi:hypothetical protein